MIDDREPRFTDHLFNFSDLSRDDLQEIVFQILDHLKLDVVRTNCTKHGNTEIVVRPSET